jgi:HlyD family secretion protein
MAKSLSPRFSSLCRNRRLYKLTIMGGTAMLAAFISAPTNVHAQTKAETPTTGAVLSLGVAASGVIAKISVADGAHVKAGQILLQVDCRPIEEDIKARSAILDAQQAAFERTRNGPRPEEIAIGEANLGVAQARAEEAHDALDRASALTTGITITKAQFLEIQRNARVTAAQLEDAKKKLALLHAGSRQEDIAEAAARRDAAAGQLAEAKARLDQCSIRAPADGVVNVLANVGQFVSTYAPVTLLRLTVGP